MDCVLSFVGSVCVPFLVSEQVRRCCVPSDLSRRFGGMFSFAYFCVGFGQVQGVFRFRPGRDFPCAASWSLSSARDQGLRFGVLCLFQVVSVEDSDVFVFS